MAAALLLGGCTSFTETAPVAPVASATGCPGTRAVPDPDRPVVQLDLTLDDDLRRVTGTETVRFTPDLPTAELVFRLVPNNPDTAARGSRLVVDGVRGDDVDRGVVERAGAADPGGLYVVRLDRELEPGETTEVTLDFTLDLGSAGFDRVGSDDGLAWWASGAPLLAWEPGVGWSRAPFVGVIGETASSPVADTTVRVSVPDGLVVLMTGDQAPPSPVVDGRRTWTSTEPVARDVSVAVGRFGTAELDVDGVRVTAGVLPGAELTPRQLAERTAEAVRALADRFGPFPYATLTVPLLPPYGGGIEYPSSILMASPRTDVLVHEVAHMWFYGMVGDDQFRDPWLDEAFATYAEALVDGAADPSDALDGAGDVGGSMADQSDDDGYLRLVYGKGAAALLAARAAAGGPAFDAALRCYVDAQAWTTATPDDLAAALAGLPAALDVLVRAGALDEDDLPAGVAGSTGGPATPTD
ncbi:peptidase M1 [Modestobacter sp. I12A-02628]|uniref:M1 family metallopeptidase n=1 Tax=Goekera deserti TaxID=2497753 RepID=A0A7K3WB90_9ACTN|nr:peptidase M1 [Goekera deserti]NDI49333.1 peptidase M1 [Goekera deserti]NEL52793.1 M1 family metallopeptidase [Goekera deserti]